MNVSESRKPLANLLDLPNELLLEIGETLADRDLNTLIETCRLFHALLNPLLWRLDFCDKDANCNHWAGYCVRRRNASDVLASTARKGNLTAARKLIEDYGVHVNQTGPRGGNPLFEAVKHGHTEFVRYMIGKGATPMVYRSMLDGRVHDSPLQHAVKKQSVEMVHVLMSVRPGKRDVFPAVTWANWRADKEITTALLHGMFNVHNMVCAMAYLFFCGTPHLMDAYLAVGGNIDAVDEFGFTPLRRATSRDLEESVEYLLKRGADAELENYAGTNAMDEAIKQGNPQMVRIFLQHGACARPGQKLPGFWNRMKCWSRRAFGRH